MLSRTILFFFWYYFIDKTLIHPYNNICTPRGTYIYTTSPHLQWDSLKAGGPFLVCGTL